MGRADGVPVAAAGDRREPRVGAGRALFPRDRRGVEMRDPGRVLRRRDRPRRQPAAPDPRRQGHEDARLGRADLDARRDGAVRHQRLRDRAAGRRAVHGQLGHLRTRRTGGMTRGAPVAGEEGRSWGAPRRSS
ncbi:conserved hypothetical protein [Burkholderia vietnamiensis]|nr:conserved hypothetical protein [Burkholderia vietnamiensis]